MYSSTLASIACSLNWPAFCMNDWIYDVLFNKAKGLSSVWCTIQHWPPLCIVCFFNTGLPFEWCAFQHWPPYCMMYFSVLAALLYDVLFNSWCIQFTTGLPSVWCTFQHWLPFFIMFSSLLASILHDVQFNTVILSVWYTIHHVFTMARMYFSTLASVLVTGGPEEGKGEWRKAEGSSDRGDEGGGKLRGTHPTSVWWARGIDSGAGDREWTAEEWSGASALRTQWWVWEAMHIYMCLFDCVCVCVCVCVYDSWGGGGVFVYVCVCVLCTCTYMYTVSLCI